MRDPWLEKKFMMMKKLGRMALLGIGVLAIGLLVRPVGFLLPYMMFIVAVLLIVPWFFYVVVLTIWHWKHRYRGGHSDLWGALLLVETSGWFKIVYWFLHILPDWRSTGRYSD